MENKDGDKGKWCIPKAVQAVVVKDEWSGARGVRMGNGAEKGGIGRSCEDFGAEGDVRMMGRLSRV